MLDTVKLYTPSFKLNEKDNEFTHTKDFSHATGELKRERLYCNLGHFSLDIKNDFLFLSTSLPKLLRGSSFYEVEENDMEQAIEMVEKKLSEVGVSVSNNKLDDFTFSRLDVCKNLEVEHYIPEYLLLLNDFTFSRRAKRDIEHETVSFRNSSQELSFYNKCKEVKQDKETPLELFEELKDKPENVLRVESRLKRAQVVDREFSPGLKFTDAFDSELCKGKLLKDFDSLVPSPEKQLDFNFKANSKLLEYISSKRKRGVFKEFLATKGAEQFLKDFRFDYAKIREFLETHYKRRQTFAILRELKEYQNLVIEHQERDLLGELRSKIAA
jgi:hypothetical protein|tara:strand:- start:239 stop:1222 length:984 start_codon:yes stop_codon:yes gene_type:complete